MNYEIQTSDVVSFGTLPGILIEHDHDVKEKTLCSYTATYLKKEVQAEGLARNLSVSAEYAGTYLDFAKLASDAQIARQSALR